MARLPQALVVDVSVGRLPELKALLEDIVVLLERCAGFGVRLEIVVPAGEDDEVPRG